jgi:hypothetical protein
MMLRRFVAGMAVAVAAILTQATSVQAGSVGTQGFADMGSPTVGGGDIFTATTFTIGDLVTTTAQTGAFDGLSRQDFGPVTFTTDSTLGVDTSFAFGNSTFGYFSSEAIVPAGTGTGSVSFFIVGNWTPGSYSGYKGLSGSYVTSFAISFNQPSGGGAISDSATISVTAASVTTAAVPEPSSIVLGLTGIVVCGLGFGLRRRSAA